MAAGIGPVKPLEFIDLQLKPTLLSYKISVALRIQGLQQHMNI